MKTTFTAILSLALSCLCNNTIADTFGSGPNQFELEFVTIGNPGNMADTTGKPNPAGAVDYVYLMGKYEISREMVTKANTVGDLEITLDEWINYAFEPRPSMPATEVSWNEAARFVNWLNASRGFPLAYKFSQEPGEDGYDSNAYVEFWQEGDSGYDPANPFRNSNAQYFLPSADEWYKAAYYDPNVNDGTGGYWDFPTGSDLEPIAVASGTDPYTAVYLQPSIEVSPADINQAGGLSPYGVMGMGGNVMEWEETEKDPDADEWWIRSIRGGAWGGGAPLMSATSRIGIHITEDHSSVLGFRVASFNPDASRYFEVPHAVAYSVSDVTFNGEGDRTVNVSESSGMLVGEIDQPMSNELSKVIFKFVLPGISQASAKLEDATLRVYVRGMAGPPPGPLSVWHSQTDNDLDLLASDYENAGYVDTSADLAQPTDEVRRYIDLDVTDWVMADYATDGSIPMSAFRLQLDEAVFDEDGLSHAWIVSPGGSSYHPELRLNFVPEPSTWILSLLGFVAIGICQRHNR